MLHCTQDIVQYGFDVFLGKLSGTDDLGQVILLIFHDDEKVIHVFRQNRVIDFRDECALKSVEYLYFSNDFYCLVR